MKKNQTLFPFKQLIVELQKSTKTLIINFNSEKNSINELFIHELQSILDWAKIHIEIKSILFSSRYDKFGEGLDIDLIKQLNHQQLLNVLKKFQHVIKTIFQLPQTTLMDLKTGAVGIAAELAMAADIRIANTHAQLHFNHLLRGHVPSSGTLNILSSLIPLAKLRNWIFSSIPVETDELRVTGIVHKFYTTDQREIVDNFLQTVNGQSSVARMQSKLAFWNLWKQTWENLANDELKIILGNLFSGDYKEYVLSQEKDRSPQFADPKDLQSTIQQKFLNINVEGLDNQH